MSEKILIVEDEPALQETLAYNLARQNYTVEIASDGRQALEIARRMKPDLLLLDLMLPHLDGFEVTRILRQETSAPIIILTARDDEIDRVIGLELGADDYLTKPFSMRELVARVKAQLRRVRLDRDEAGRPEEKSAVMKSVEPESGEPSLALAPTLAFGNLELDQTRREVRLDGRPLALKPKEYDLLLYLARHRGIAMTRDLILQRVWGWDFSGGSRTVDVHVRWLREKIEPDPAAPVRIVTVRGAGYRFEG
jgi:DNA-binding response OmpR family regulator